MDGCYSLASIPSRRLNVGSFKCGTADPRWGSESELRWGALPHPTLTIGADVVILGAPRPLQTRRRHHLAAPNPPGNAQARRLA